MRNVLGIAFVAATFVPGMITTAAQNQPLIFEVASVKPSNAGPGARNPLPCSGGPVQLDPTHFAATNKNLYSLIALAYGMNCGVMMTQDLLFGDLPWLTSAQFDIAAVIPQGTQQERYDPGILPQTIQGMLQQLLADRLKLTLHRETRTLSPYVLVLEKKGLKFQKAPNDRDCAASPGTCGLRGGPAAGLIGKSVDMSQLAQSLALLIGRSVADQTGVAGKFDIEIPPWSGSINNIDNGREPVADPNGPSIFSVLQDVGLRLESRKVPLEVFIIDHAEKPDAN
jgi:uncharacterized protein (TIGR03435 family)